VDDQNPGVVPGSPADKAGIKEGDVITKVGNDTVNSTNSLQSLIAKHNSGDKVRVTLVRDGKEQTVEVTLGDTPAGS
jgi:S1-C subfamily serine protease